MAQSPRERAQIWEEICKLEGSSLMRGLQWATNASLLILVTLMRSQRLLVLLIRPSITKQNKVYVALDSLNEE
jgi:hypothetical protein